MPREVKKKKKKLKVWETSPVVRFPFWKSRARECVSWQSISSWKRGSKRRGNLSFFFSFICIDLSSSVQSPIPRLASNNSGQRWRNDARKWIRLIAFVQSERMRMYHWRSCLDGSFSFFLSFLFCLQNNADACGQWTTTRRPAIS